MQSQEPGPENSLSFSHARVSPFSAFPLKPLEAMQNKLWKSNLADGSNGFFLSSLQNNSDLDTKLKAFYFRSFSWKKKGKMAFGRGSIIDKKLLTIVFTNITPTLHLSHTLIASQYFLQKKILPSLKTKRHYTYYREKNALKS